MRNLNYLISLNSMRGKLIALYGVNNLGKTTQAKLLVERLSRGGKNAHYLKYPIYDLVPSGLEIEAYLRGGNPLELSSREFQIVQILNRTQYDEHLRRRIEKGEWIVVEDYIGTGLAWGIGAEVEAGFLENLNKHLLVEDCAILIEGDRFLEGRESIHKHETDDVLTERVREVHQELADRLGWYKVQANKTREEVHENIWARVKLLFNV